jgi:uridine phosphorylase
VPIHVHPTAELAERVLLPGDPGRALRLAQELLEGPKMFNHNRGLWGYSGTAADGQPLTIQATGMGGPSAAIVAAELIDLGARQLVRVGTCRVLDPALSLGALLVATEAICDDGTSRALGAGERVRSDPVLLAGLLAAAGETALRGPVVSIDLFYGGGERVDGWREAGALAVELETAALFALAARRGAQAGCALIVGGSVNGDQPRLEAEQLHEAELRLGRLAFAAVERAS